jgi:ribosomal protein S6
MNQKKLQQAGNIQLIINTIIGPEKNNFRTVIKYFIMKLVRSNLKDYDSFKLFDFQKIQMTPLVKDFNFEEKIVANFDYSFLPIENIEIYQEKWTKFLEGYQKEFNISSNEFIELINQNSGFDIFFDITVNKILSNLNKENYVEDNKNILNKFSTWALGIINKLNISNPAKEFLKIFYDSEKFIQTTQPYFGKISVNDLEMIIFSYKVLVSCLMEKPQHFYFDLLSNQMLNVINNSFIPGDEPNENIWVNSVIEVEKFLIKYNDAYKGAYVCSCGQWYDVDHCGLPMAESVCFNCNQKIGGTYHVPVDRENHFRVFKDKAQQDYIVKWVKDCKWVEEHRTYHTFRYKTVEDFKKEVEEFTKEEHKGIKQVSQGFFNKIDKKIRDLNQISYRLLALIFYSSLYFGQLMGYIKENEIKQLIPKDSKSLFDVMCKTYKFLENALKAKGINEIQIFLNYIYPQLSNTLKKTPSINTKEIRLNLENKINEIVDNSINGYEDYKKKYLEWNNTLNQMDINTLRCIIQESIDPLVYPQDKYPFFRYFVVPKYPNQSQLIEELELIPQYEQKYPIITNFLNDNGQIDALSNIIKINPFVNSMIELYTYKITRDQGKELKIKDELLRLNNEILNKQFRDFKDGWNHFMNFLAQKQKINEIKDQYLLKYKCRPPMVLKDIKDSDVIANVLNDDGEWLYGMYLAAAYQMFINWQNTFLNNIIGNISQSGVLHYFKEQLEKEIYAQDATRSEVVSLDLDNENSIYNSFNEIITAFSKRNFIDLEGNINYRN